MGHILGSETTIAGQVLMSPFLQDRSEQHDRQAGHGHGAHLPGAGQRRARPAAPLRGAEETLHRAGQVLATA